MQHSPFLEIFAGLAFFIYGLEFVSQSLKELMGNRVRELLSKLSDNKVLSITVGILLTMLLQSSGAVTSLLVGLGNAGVISLAQVMGVIIGSAIGTTITVQLISLDVTKIGLPLFTLSFFFYFSTKKHFQKNIIGIFMGFGLVFYGLGLMSSGCESFKDFQIFKDIFGYLAENPWVALLATAVFSSIAHSSAVAIGLAMSLTASGVITIYDAMFWVYGANIGTTTTGLHTAMGGNYVARQIAWANVLFKVGTLFLVVFFTDKLVELVGYLGGEPARQVANAHTIFNIVGAIAFFPFVSKAADVLNRVIRPRASEKAFGTKYIDKKSIMSPVIAISEASREVSRMGDIVHSMIVDSVQLFHHEDQELVRSVHDRDNKVDLLQKEIKGFLVSMGGEQTLADRVVRMISFVSDLENAADVVDRGLLELARKKHALKLNFSKEGWEEICSLHHEVTEMVKITLSCFQLQDKGLAEQVIEKKRAITRKENQLRTTHFERLNKGYQDSFKTSSIHLDALADYRRIASVLCNHAYDVLKNGNRVEM